MPPFSSDLENLSCRNELEKSVTCLILSRQKQANKPLTERQHIPGLLPLIIARCRPDRCVTIDGNITDDGIMKFDFWFCYINEKHKARPEGTHDSL